jgi:hypothetical protein
VTGLLTNDRDTPSEAQRPPEPTGLGAVVADRNGHTYTRTTRLWLPGARKPWTIEIDIGTAYNYDEIPAPIKIRSPGMDEAAP